MWPSRETASCVYDWANLGLIVGLVIGAVSTALIVWMGNLKEAYLELDVGNANAVAETAKENAAKANERAAVLEARAASLAKEAQDARLEQEKLKAQLSWRALTPKMLEQLTAVLSTSKSSITLAYTANDPEALFFAIQISKAFENAKWDLRSESRTYANRVLFGITIPGPVNKDVELVRKALRAAGIQFSITDVPQPDMTIASPGETPVMVMIGAKPPPF